MEQIIDQLKRSLEDDFLSKPERRTLESVLRSHALDKSQLNALRSKVFDLANEKVSDKNYRFIVEWIKEVSNTLGNYSLNELGKSDAFFSPGAECRNAIVQQLNDAQKHLKICVFTISDDSIAETILRTHKRGVDIKIITDNDKSFDLGSDIQRLAKAGIAVKIDGTTDHMHHKFMVVDGIAVLTGSYNWTRSAAQYNHENILLTKDQTAVKSFLGEFDQLWNVMRDYM
jgi:mitochondrial cardiolipin hydrolase